MAETFTVEWIPSEAVWKAARERGCDNDSPLDYIEPSDHALVASAKTFAAAVTLGKSKLGIDFFGQVEIAHCVRVRRITGEQWEPDAVWYVSDEADVLFEAYPDHRPEIDLYDDEYLVA